MISYLALLLYVQLTSANCIISVAAWAAGAAAASATTETALAATTACGCNQHEACYLVHIHLGMAHHLQAGNSQRIVRRCQSAC